jgi:hypothetical protein
MSATGKMTNIELLTALGNIYGFEVRSDNGQGSSAPAPGPNQKEKKMRPRCKEEGCDKQAAREGLCYRHYMARPGAVWPYGKKVGGGLL